MSAQTIINEIHAYTDESEPEAVLEDSLSLMEYALREAMASLNKHDQAVVQGLVCAEIIYRMKRRMEQAA